MIGHDFDVLIMWVGLEVDGLDVGLVVGFSLLEGGRLVTSSKCQRGGCDLDGGLLCL